MPIEEGGGAPMKRSKLKKSVTNDDSSKKKKKESIGASRKGMRLRRGEMGERDEIAAQSSESPLLPELEAGEDESLAREVLLATSSFLGTLKSKSSRKAFQKEQKIAAGLDSGEDDDTGDEGGEGRKRRRSVVKKSVEELKEESRRNLKHQKEVEMRRKAEEEKRRREAEEAELAEKKRKRQLQLSGKLFVDNDDMWDDDN